MRTILILGIILFVAYLIPQPSNHKNWNRDQKILPEIIINDGEVSIKNIRNNRYKSTEDYSIDYYDLDFYLSSIRTLDYIVEPFGSRGAAHTFLSFGLVTGEYFSVSVEIRKEEGESFDPLRGVLKNYEIMYVIADERDVIDLRVRHRNDYVYLYPTIANDLVAQEIFLDIAERVNELKESPEFYNTITNTCTTNIVDHINKVSEERVKNSFKILLPARSDELALELGFLKTDLSLGDARLEFRIDDKIERCDSLSSSYSKCIRKR